MGQVARKSSCPKLCRPKFKVKSPEMLSYVALNLIMLSNILTSYYTFIALVMFRLIKVKTQMYYAFILAFRSIMV